MSTGPYREAGDLVNRVLTERRGLKSLVFSSPGSSSTSTTPTMRCSKSTYAVACRTLEHRSRIDDILEADGGHFRKKVMEGCRNVGLAYVLLYELLFSPYRKIRGGGAVKRRIVKHEEELRRVREMLVGAFAGDEVSSSNRADTARIQRPVFPRYVRVNTLKIDVATAARMLQDTLDADTRGEETSSVADTGTSSGRRPPRRAVYADPHVPDLLVLPPGTDLHDHELVSDGRVVLQDKSSCLPALALVHGGTGGGNWDEGDGDGPGDEFWTRRHGTPGGGGGIDVLDACAAPGNKTTHLAALLDCELRRHTGASPRHGLGTVDVKARKNDERDGAKCVTKRGKKKKTSGGSASASPSADEDGVTSRIFACDRDSKRVGILRRRVDHLVPKTERKPKDGSASGIGEGTSPRPPLVEVVPLHADFLRLEHTDPRLSRVRTILLDPSCTGSGIVSQPDRSHGDVANERDGDDGRIDALANFQLVALKHAMGFPNVERIVYSTCSVHDRENEAVVAKALREYNGEILGEDGSAGGAGGDAEGDGDAGRDGGGTWELVAPTCLSGWSRRGRSGFSGLDVEQSRCLVRCDATKGDETNGFFVAYLERTRSRRTGGELMQGREGFEESTETVAKGGHSRRLRHGVPIYNGEYAGVPHNAGISKRGGDTGATKDENSGSSKKRKGGCSEDGGTVERRPSDRMGADVHGRKKMKRLKWKLKQKKMKEERLKRKKAASSAGT